MRNFQDVCEWVKRETGQAVHPYSTYDFGRSKDYSHRSVILSQTNAAQLIQKAMPSLPEGVLMFTGTSGTRLGDGRREEDVEVVIGRGKDQWDKLRIARTIDCNRDWTTEEIITRLKRFDEKYGISIFHAETDDVGIEFLCWPQFDDLDQLCQEIYEFCPDIVHQGWDSVKDLKEVIEATGLIHLWWD